jgi:hypothetical protein
MMALDIGFSTFATGKIVSTIRVALMNPNSRTLCRDHRSPLALRWQFA